MLQQDGKVRKFGTKWTGPFIVGPRSGRTSFKLLQLNGKPVSTFDYHEDYLKPFSWCPSRYGPAYKKAGYHYFVVRINHRGVLRTMSIMYGKG